MLSIIVFVCFSIINVIFCTEEVNNYKIVSLDEGVVKGEKYWNGDFYEFFGVPYAKVPTGKHRFKAPLPPQAWTGTLEAKDNRIQCPQNLYTGDDPDDIVVVGQEDCLVMNLFVPTIANEDNLLPVIVYIHSGAFAAGHGNMARFNYLTRHDVIVISFNYRLGAIGFVCLGTEDIPGNAGLKDQLAALRWINKNIKKFGGNPKKVTLAGFSVGAAMAEQLALSKSTDGLIDKLILESGSALSSWAIDRDPISTAANYAISLGFNNTKNVKDLTDFYLKTNADVLATKSLNFFLKNGTFGFAPCVENIHKDTEAILTESPMDILKKGKISDIAILTGYANMEGLARINHILIWEDEMEENFSDFLPTDLQFKDENSKTKAITNIKNYYFKGEEVSMNTLQGYVDYTSDALFKYPIIKSAKLHVLKTKRPIFVYEFSYVGNLNLQHNYMDLVRGAGHRDQTSYILDFSGWTSKYEDLDTRDRLTGMWTDFAIHEDPTAYESPLIDFKWHAYSRKEPYYLQINTTLEVKRGLFEDQFEFWDKIYDSHYWNPTAPKMGK